MPRSLWRPMAIVLVVSIWHLVLGKRTQNSQHFRKLRGSCVWHLLFKFEYFLSSPSLPFWVKYIPSSYRFHFFQSVLARPTWWLHLFPTLFATHNMHLFTFTLILLLLTLIIAAQFIPHQCFWHSSTTTMNWYLRAPQQLFYSTASIRLIIISICRSTLTPKLSSSKYHCKNRS